MDEVLDVERLGMSRAQDALTNGGLVDMASEEVGGRALETSEAFFAGVVA